jgi:hypothetical protein
MSARVLPPWSSLGNCIFDGGAIVAGTELPQDAAMIAHRVNCFDDLLAACEGMLRHIDDVGDDQDLMTRRAAMVAAIQKARGGEA